MSRIFHELALFTVWSSKRLFTLELKIFAAGAY